MKNPRLIVSILIVLAIVTVTLTSCSTANIASTNYEDVKAYEPIGKANYDYYNEPTNRNSRSKQSRLISR